MIYGAVLGIAAIIGLDKEDLVDFYRGRKTLGEDLAAGLVLALIAPAALAQIGLRWRKSQKPRPWIHKRIGVDTAVTPRARPHALSTA